MITGQILQNTIDGLKTITKCELCVLEADGSVLATTDDNLGKEKEVVIGFINSPAYSQEIGGSHFFKIMDEDELEYVVLIQGSLNSEEIYIYGKMVAYQIKCLYVAYRERYDKENFIKNLLLDNLLIVDILNRSKKLHIPLSKRRIVFIIETEKERDNGSLETVKSLFSSDTRDYITAVDEKNIILIKELDDDEDKDSFQRIAKTIVDMLSTENMTNVVVAYGSVVNELREVSRSYKEAKTALDVGRIFYNHSRVIAYENLGIGRLIYQLPVPLCKMFLNEVFSDHKPEELDDELRVTIDKFFETNLNSAETSKKLFIHRNTLKYRIEKIQKLTGLNMKIFEDCVTLKIALMVDKYMNYLEQIDF